MRSVKYNIIFLALMVLLGCGHSDDSGKGGAPDQGKKVLINGKTPQNYYLQFQQKVTGDCTKRTFEKYFLAVGEVPVGGLTNGLPTYALTNIMMNQDGTYVAEYTENLVLRLTDSGYSSKLVFRKQLSGQWTITQDAKLSFAGLGSAGGVIVDDQDSLELHFDTNINSDGLAGQVKVAAYSYTYPSDPEIEKFCRGAAQ